MCSALTASVQAQNFLPGNGYARISLNSLFWYNVLLLIKEIVTAGAQLAGGAASAQGALLDHRAWSET